MAARAPHLDKFRLRNLTPWRAVQAQAAGASAYVPKEASVEVLRETVCAVAPSPSQRPNVAA